MTPETFRATLDRLGYSPSQAAEAIGCSPRLVQQILAGNRRLSPTVAASLASHSKLIEAGIHQPIPPRRRGRPRA